MYILKNIKVELSGDEFHYADLKVRNFKEFASILKPMNKDLKVSTYSDGSITFQVKQSKNSIVLDDSIKVTADIYELSPVKMNKMKRFIEG